MFIRVRRSRRDLLGKHPSVWSKIKPVLSWSFPAIWSAKHLQSLKCLPVTDGDTSLVNWDEDIKRNDHEAQVWIQLLDPLLQRRCSQATGNRAVSC